jgi:pyruvate dehydrogenase E2 component (dihydrolipoamide acetyltransferase)
MIDILMPRLSDTMTEGAIAAWHKKPGDTVTPGDLLVEIETDKALMEQEAYDAGVLAEILVEEGENVAIGTPIARLDDGSGAPAQAGPATIEKPATSAPAPVLAEPQAVPEIAVPHLAVPQARAAVARPKRRAATPLVRKLAKERGIDLATVPGSGPGGRIIRADLDALPGPAASVSTVSTAAPTESPAPPADGSDLREPETVPFDAIRHAVASRLAESGTTIPTFTATASADVGALLALRAQINEVRTDTGVRISVNDLLVRAVALTLREHPGVNASYSPEGRGQTLLHGRVHVGIAVASPAGLVVPVVRDADRTAASAISAATKQLASKAAERKLTTEDMSDGTFTISNLGMYGIEHFTAIINPPQGAILAVGTATDELALVDGVVEVHKRIRFTLTADHRIIDGALAAQFLASLTALIEQPLRIIA